MSLAAAGGAATGAIEATTVRGVAGVAGLAWPMASTGRSSGAASPAFDRCWRVATQAGTTRNRVSTM